MKSKSLLAAALLCTACAPAAVPDIATTQFASTLNVDLTRSTKLANGEYVRDTAAGTGAPLATGQTLSVYYTLYLPDGTLVQTNSGGSAFSFTLGAGQVIPGWDQGFGAMNAGGTRQLIIPPALGYGNNAVGNIPPESILVFDVQVLSAQ